MRGSTRRRSGSCAATGRTRCEAGRDPLVRSGVANVIRWRIGGSNALFQARGAAPDSCTAASAQAIREADGALCLVVPPEGTRSKTRQWRTGFYWIAHQAGVPIVMAYMDYPRKRSGLGPVFKPSGDIEADMAQIKTYYAQYKGKNWRQFSTD